MSLSEVHTSNTGGGFKKHPIWILLQTIYSPESAKVHRLLETSSSTPPPPPLLSVSLRLSPTHKLTLARTALALFLILWSLWKKAFLLKYYVESFHLSSSYSNRTIHNKKRCRTGAEVSFVKLPQKHLRYGNKIVSNYIQATRRQLKPLQWKCAVK